MNSKFYVFLLLVVLNLNLLAGQKFTVLSSNQNSITLEFNLPEYSVDTIQINGENYLKFNLFGASGYYDEAGYPSLGVYSTLLGVPSENGNTVQVLSNSSLKFKGKVAPLVYDQTEGVEKNTSLAEGYKNYLLTEPVLPGEYGIIRKHGVMPVNVIPCVYNPNTDETTLYTKIRIKVNYSTQRSALTSIGDDFVKDMLINYDVAKKWSLQKNRKTAKANDVNMSSGTWYQFEAPEEGIYKITYGELESMGIDASTVDPRTIKIFNNGGRELRRNIIEAGTGNEEIAIYVSGEEDGSFDPGDYILFYGRGVNYYDIYDVLDYQQSAAFQIGEVVLRRNAYTEHNYYLITSGGTEGKRMNSKESVELNQESITTTEAGYYHEEDLVNLYQSGKEFYGEQFTSSQREHTFLMTLNNPVADAETSMKVVFANNSSTTAYLTSYINGTQFFRTYVYSGDGNYIYGRESTIQRTYNYSLSDNMLSFKLEFETNDPAVEGYLNYIDYRYTSHLDAVNDKLVFFSPINVESSKYLLSDFSNSNIYLFDVSHNSDVQMISNPEISGGQLIFGAVTPPSDNKMKFVAQCESAFYTVSNISQMQNSSVRAETNGAEYIIVTDKTFATQAERLANYRENESPYKLSSKVFYMDEIYNEFNCGAVDITALRNFMKYAYDNWSVTPEYVLFLGDGDYDYKDIEGFGRNFIPSDNTINSLTKTSSYSTDDYYFRIDGDDYLLELAAGRIPVNTAEEAELSVNKIIAYENNKNFGVWRSRFLMVADDDVVPSGVDVIEHTYDSERVILNTIPNYISLNKVYLGDYRSVSTPVGTRKPDANQALIDGINNGTSIINFFGHGNPTTWTDERIFVGQQSLPLINNTGKYFFLLAATCDFGRYDDPSTLGSAEEMMLMEDKGAIGVYAATRAVYSTGNYNLVNNFFNSLFENKDTDNTNLPAGKLNMISKNLIGTIQIANKSKYILFCDPAIKLVVPQDNGMISSINGNSLQDTTLQIKALQTVQIEGVVQNADSSINTGYNGEVIITVYDSEKTTKLKEMTDTNDPNVVFEGGTIFRGRANVVNGSFNTAFVVPKDISYNNQQGKIVAYFYNDSQEGVASTTNIVVGGTDTTITDDGKGPEIEIFFDDYSQTGSYLVNPNFTFLMTLEDETGLNTTGAGIGRKLEGQLDGDNSNPIDFSEYFIGELNAAGKKGTVEYQFSSMEPGEHQIDVKAWDVFNNYSTLTAYFSVVDEGGLTIRDVANYPNPFGGSTYFTFQHNYLSPLNVKIKIYTIAGRMINEIETYGINDKFVKIFWDGRDNDGDVLANGTYLYKLIVESTDGTLKENYLGKLAIIR